MNYQALLFFKTPHRDARAIPFLRAVAETLVHAEHLLQHPRVALGAFLEEHGVRPGKVRLEVDIHLRVRQAHETNKGGVVGASYLAGKRLSERPFANK